MTIWVVEFIDVDTRSIERVLELSDAAQAGLIENFAIDEMLREDASVVLEPDEAAWLFQATGEKPGARNHECIVRGRHWLDALPYEVHTRRELRLMLEGRKPLAMFYDAVAVTDPWVFPEDVFAPHVASGAMVREEHIENGYRLLLFALASERWRISAYLDMSKEADRFGWNDDFERRQGELLGYEPWQMDYWMQGRAARCAAARG